MPTDRRPPGRDLAAALLVALLAAALFLPTTAGHRLLSSDREQLLERPAVRAEGARAALLAAPRADGDQPLARLATRAALAVAGERASAQHGLEALLHALGAGLLYLALVRMTSRPGLALFAAAGFALHPLVVEPVAWVAMRGRVLAGVALPLVLLAHERALRRPGPLARGLLFALFAAGLAAHPALAGLPLLLLGCELARGRSLARASLALLAPLALAALVLVRAWTAALDPAFPPGERLLLAPLATLSLLGRVLLPLGLAPLRPGPTLVAPEAILGLVLAAALAVAARRRRDPALRLGALWFLALALPATLLPTGAPPGADRDVQLALPGALLALAALASPWASRLAALLRATPAVVSTAGALFVLASWSAVAHARTADWRDGLRLTERARAAYGPRPEIHRARADELLHRGHLALAGDELARALTLDPEDADALVRRADIARRHSRLGEARRDLERAVELRPANARARFALGEVLRRMGRPADMAQAERELAAAVALDPTLVRARVKLAVVLLLGRRFEEALAGYERTLAIDAGYAEAHWGRAVALWRLERTEEAVRDFERALELEPDSTDARTNFGRLLIDLGEPERAAQVLQRAVELDPRFTEASLQYARALEQAGRPEEALEFYERTLILSPAHVGASVELAWLYAESGRLEQAERQARLALIEAPGHVSANDLLARLAARRGDWAEARERLERAVTGAPEREGLVRRLGIALVQLGELERAELRFDDLERRDPRSADAAYGHGLVALGRGDLDGARERFRQALERRPQDVDALHQLATASALAGDWSAAAAADRAALALRPDAQPVLVALAELLACAPDDEVRDGEEALALAERAVTGSGRSDPRALEALAAALAELGRSTEALAAQDEALGHAPGEQRQEMERRRAAYARGAPWRLEAER